MPSLAMAQLAPGDLPGAADASRVKPDERQLIPQRDTPDVKRAPIVSPPVPVPQGAETLQFQLNNVKIEGATAFTPDQLKDIYAPYLSRQITLDMVYYMAGAITERYRNAGYFLSLAIVPDQSIEGGEVIIQVVEGYVGKVEIEGDAAQHRVIQQYIDALLAKKPLTSDEMESFLLRLNDLPGYNFTGVLSPLEDGEQGAVKLALVVADKDGKGLISFDNASSRFLGPNEASATYAKSFLPLQQTTLSVLSSLPIKKLRYATLTQAAVIAPDVIFDVTGSVTHGEPGYTLEPFEIESDSAFVGVSLSYQWIRQRRENLALKFTLDGRNTNSDLLGTPLTRDRIRVLRANATYDAADDWQGYNIASFTVSQGLSGLGASKAGEITLSRAEAEPDFTKVEMSLTRLQSINHNWSMLVAGAAQRASGPLFSAEEFGYGGQVFGRAFDASELTGDHGVNGSLELRYRGIEDWYSASVMPYAFYDIGVVWNDDSAQPSNISGASAGFGVRATTESGFAGNLGLAWPLTRSISAPIYGQTSNDPRIILQFSKSF